MKCRERWLLDGELTRTGQIKDISLGKRRKKRKHALKSVERGRRRAAILSRQTGQEDNLDGKTDEHRTKRDAME